MPGVFAEISPRPPVVLFTCTLSRISLEDLKTRAHPTYTHPCPDSTFSLSSTSLHQLLRLGLRAHTHTRALSAAKSLRCPTVPYVVFALRCAPTVFCFCFIFCFFKLIGSSLLQQTQHLLFGRFYHFTLNIHICMSRYILLFTVIITLILNCTSMIAVNNSGPPEQNSQQGVPIIPDSLQGKSIFSTGSFQHVLTAT